jgi:hypothetical protein
MSRYSYNDIILYSVLYPAVRQILYKADREEEAMSQIYLSKYILIFQISNQTERFRGSHLPALPCIQLGPDIEVKVQLSLPFAIISPCVEVNYVLHFCSAPINDPVVSIKWRCISQN